MRLHLVSLPHTETTHEYEWCAYTAKVRKFSTMMHSLGHTVYLYAGEHNEADCTEHIPCKTTLGKIPPFETDHLTWYTFNNSAHWAIQQRAHPGDYLCLIAGRAQERLAQWLPNLTPVEWGVGYGGVFTDYRVFESEAWRHTVYGNLYGTHTADGKFYDAVIPNFFETEAFPTGDGAGDYLLYVGRLIDRKGLQIVREISDRAGLPLVVAGDGDKNLIPYNATYVGVVGPTERAKLMGEARCILTPTTYVEPFGGVAVEAQMCGTPAITTPWGAFTETIEHGKTGYRCHTLKEFLMAVNMAPGLDRDYIRQRAINTYSTDVVKYQYQEYFNRLETLKGDGWYDGV